MRSVEASKLDRRSTLRIGLGLAVAGGLVALTTPRSRLIREVAGAFSSTAGVVVGLDQESAEGKFVPTRIIPLKELSPTTQSIVLSLPGQNYQAAPENIAALTSLSKLGVPTYAVLGNNPNEEQELIKDLYGIQKTTQLKRMSWHCNSSSWPLAAQVIMRTSDRIAPDYIILDDTPEGTPDLKGILGSAGEAILSSGYGPSTILTSLADAVQFHTPLAPYTNGDAASPVTAYKQLEDLSRSDRITHEFGQFLRQYNIAHPEKKINIVYMRLKNPAGDTLVNERKAINDFRREGIPLYVATVGGPHQTHDDDAINADAANAALLQAIATLG
jgi:hypothetical protein